MSDITLYDFDLDEGCYKVRLMLSALGLAYKAIAVDVVPGAEQKSAALLKLNPRGALPILIDDGQVLHDAEPILTYLARTYDAEQGWLPAAPVDFGGVMMWLAFAGHDLWPASMARLNAMFEEKADPVAVRRAARDAFRIMDDHMTRREFEGGEWFVGARPTVADIALFPAIALSRDSGIEHDGFPALRRWMRRVRAIPGFKTMPGIPDYY